MSPRGPRTEVDAYVFIKNTLKSLGWDTRNPDHFPQGQLWTQNECLGNPEIKRLLGLGRPENIVKVTDTVLWVIEAKGALANLTEADVGRIWACEGTQSERPDSSQVRVRYRWQQHRWLRYSYGISSFR